MAEHAPRVSRESRIHDFLFDPNFIVSTKRDHQRYASIAALQSATMNISPVFKSMFSDLKNHPRQKIVLKTPEHISHTFKKWVSQANYADVKGNAAVDCTGTDRFKFFKSPVLARHPREIKFPEKLRKVTAKAPISQKPKNVGTQTRYRESSAQTSPWKTEHYEIVDGSDPEILKLNFLKENLPPGMHEVEIIHKARKKRAWEKLMPDIEDAASLEKRRQILEAIETEEWAFREEEINQIQNLRLELLEKMLQEILDETANRAEGRIMRITTRLQTEREQKLRKMHHKTNRELRRLYRHHFGITTKYHKTNIVDEHADYTSELYAPLMRFGENPKRGHLKIALDDYQPLLIGVENYSTTPRWLDEGKITRDEPIKLPGRRLCIRETKWTEPVLKQLHEELLSLRISTKFKCTLRKRIVKEEALDDTKRVTGQSDEEKEDYASALILQCIIRGRSTQTLIYEGRDRCRELIQELQSTHVLVLAQTEEVKRKRLEVMGQQRMREIEKYKDQNLEELLHKLQGTVAGTLFDFLNKELIRILDERRAHALALLYERERRDKEAAEAGRRQVEERRRQEHDEMFKQVIKVHQDTVDLYLRDIITEGIEHVSKENAEDYVKTLAAQIDEKFREEPKNALEKEEIIADMIHNTIIPEAEKIKVRQKLRQRQQKFLRCAHEAIYDKFEKLPKISDDEIWNKFSVKSSEEMELPSMPDETPTDISVMCCATTDFDEQEFIDTEVANVKSEISE